MFFHDPEATNDRRLSTSLLIQPFRPPMVLIENVLGITTTLAGAFMADILACLRDYGYVVQTHFVDANKFPPVSRRCWFLMAVLADLDRGPSRLPAPRRMMGAVVYGQVLLKSLLTWAGGASCVGAIPWQHCGGLAVGCRGLV